MKLFIVNLEIKEARKLKNTIEWETYGVEQVFTAYSEEKARELSERVKPDLVICDTGIAADGGLGFLEWLRGRYSLVELILIGDRLSQSSFRTWLRLGILDYLEKPVQEEQLKENLMRIADRAAARKSEEEDRRYGKYWRENHILIQEVFWKNLCLNRIHGGPEKIEESAKQVNAALDKDSLYKMVLITLGNQEEVHNTWGEDLGEAAIQNLARAVMKKEGRRSKVIVIYTRIVIILEADEFDGVEERCQTLAEKCRRELGAEILCYISGTIFCEKMAETYSTLLAYSKDDVLHQNQITRVSGKRGTREEGIVIPKEWSTILYTSNPMALVQEVEKFLVPLARMGQLTEKNFRIFQQDILQLFFTYMEKKELSAHELYHNQEIYKLYKIAILSIDGMCRWIRACIEYMMGLSGEEHGERIVLQVKNYIRDNLKQDITMKEIARITHLNPDYTTRLFKRKTGMTVKKYLVRARMEYAKKLLLTTELSVSEIAVESGYDNFSYFIKNFRKYYEMTPNQFRKSCF